MIEAKIISAFISAFIMGLMSSTHCFGMCGGISAAFGINNLQQSSIWRLSRLFAYNSGRISCYVLLGALFGFFSQLFTESFQLLILPLRIFAGLMLIAMGCYVAQWWMGITTLEKAGQRVWKHVLPLSLKLTPMHSLTSAYLFGSLWGLLPCGLVYSMLVWVSASGNAVTAALLMFAFGLGTLPVMVVTGYGAAQLQSVLQHRHVRLVTALLLIVFGVWTMLSASGHSH